MCVAAVCVRMKSVLDSETVDGWAMDGEWMDGMVSGREAEGKKKTDQGWGNRTWTETRPKAKVKYQGCGLEPGSMEDDSLVPPSRQALAADPA